MLRRALIKLFTRRLARRRLIFYEPLYNTAARSVIVRYYINVASSFATSETSALITATSRFQRFRDETFSLRLVLLVVVYKTASSRSLLFIVLRLNEPECWSRTSGVTHPATLIAVRFLTATEQSTRKTGH